MKTFHLLDYLRRSDGETLATFGDARLVKHLNGKIELRGGSRDDRPKLWIAKSLVVECKANAAVFLLWEHCPP